MLAEKKTEIECIQPLWETPPTVRSLITTRLGGVSLSPYHSFNLGCHVGDNPDHVAKNRQLLTETIQVKPVWLSQVHGNKAIWIDEKTPDNIEADAAITSTPNVACTVMLADCLPVLLCDRGGTAVAAIHAGWKGLSKGVIEETVKKMGLSPKRLLAYLGPCVSQDCFEVGAEVREEFLILHPDNALFFKENSEQKWQADLPGLAEKKLRDLGINYVRFSGRCTVCDERFFSFRRESITGRFAVLIWMNRDPI